MAKSRFSLNTKKRCEKKPSQTYQPWSNFPIYPVTEMFLSNINLTKRKGFRTFNLTVYWKEKYNQSWKKTLVVVDKS